MEIKERFLVLACGKPYDFVPDGETEALTGCKMYYVGCSDVSKKFVDDETGTLGYFPQKATMPTDFFSKCEKVGLPCFADFTLNVKLTSKGSDVSIKNVDFVK